MIVHTARGTLLIVAMGQGSRGSVRVYSDALDLMESMADGGTAVRDNGAASPRGRRYVADVEVFDLADQLRHEIKRIHYETFHVEHGTEEGT